MFPETTVVYDGALLCTSQWTSASCCFEMDLWNGGMGEWQIGGMAGWRGEIAERQNGYDRMAEWRNGGTS